MISVDDRMGRLRVVLLRLASLSQQYITHRLNITLNIKTLFKMIFIPSWEYLI